MPALPLLTLVPRCVLRRGRGPWALLHAIEARFWAVMYSCIMCECGSSDENGARAGVSAPNGLADRVSTVCLPAYLFAWVMWAFGAYRARAGVLRCFLFLFSKNAAWYRHVRVVCPPI